MRRYFVFYKKKCRIYAAFGVSQTPKLIEVGRENLVGQYVGQTAQKTKEVLDRALGDVLFIDEAYTLTKDSEDNFGKEAVDTILHYMENNKGKIVVIFAGYLKEMEYFFQCNPAFKAHLGTIFYFEDYSIDQLMEILDLQCLKHGYYMTTEAEEKARKKLLGYKNASGCNFGNGRTVINMFRAAQVNQNIRIGRSDGLTDKELMTLTEEDFE